MTGQLQKEVVERVYAGNYQLGVEHRDGKRIARVTVEVPQGEETCPVHNLPIHADAISEPKCELCLSFNVEDEEIYYAA